VYLSVESDYKSTLIKVRFLLITAVCTAFQHLSVGVWSRHSLRHALRSG
jgi:hypothetical protein